MVLKSAGMVIALSVLRANTVTAEIGLTSLYAITAGILAIIQRSVHPSQADTDAKRSHKHFRLGEGMFYGDIGIRIRTWHEARCTPR